MVIDKIATGNPLRPRRRKKFLGDVGDVQAERDELRGANTVLQLKIDRLRELLDEVKSCGHWSDCPAGVNEKYRCRCAYGILVEAEPW